MLRKAGRLPVGCRPRPVLRASAAQRLAAAGLRQGGRRARLAGEDAEVRQLAQVQAHAVALRGGQAALQLQAARVKPRGAVAHDAADVQRLLLRAARGCSGRARGAAPAGAAPAALGAPRQQGLAHAHSGATRQARGGALGAARWQLLAHDSTVVRPDTHSGATRQICPTPRSAARASDAQAGLWKEAIARITCDATCTGALAGAPRPRSSAAAKSAARPSSSAARSARRPPAM